MRAGFSFMQAMELVSREMEPPISEEFQHVMRDISYGMLMEQAPENMEKRVGINDFSFVVTAVSTSLKSWILSAKLSTAESVCTAKF